VAVLTLVTLTTVTTGTATTTVSGALKRLCQSGKILSEKNPMKNFKNPNETRPRTYLSRSHKKFQRSICKVVHAWIPGKISVWENNSPQNTTAHQVVAEEARKEKSDNYTEQNQNQISG
jgi:hypothetical protein